LPLLATCRAGLASNPARLLCGLSCIAAGLTCYLPRLAGRATGGLSDIPHRLACRLT
jgi:hypothetical protein